MEDALSSPENDRHDHLRLRLKALGAGLWNYDIDADSISCDARWYEMVGLPEGSVKQVGDFRGHIHPEDVERATSVDFERVNEMIARDERYHVDFRIVRPDGELRMLRSVACLVIDHDTGHRLAIGCVTDTTGLGDIDPPPAPEQAVPAADGADAADNSLTAREIECLR